MGIIAVTEREPSAGVQDALASMRAAMLAQSPGQPVCEQVFPGAGFCGTGKAGQTFLARSGPLSLWADGEIYEDAYRQAGQPLALAEWLLQRYLSGGAAGLQGLNGLYVVLVWDAEARRLEIVNDRYGIARLYRWDSPAGLVVSTRLHAIAAHPSFRPALDEAALADFLSVDHLLEQRTFLQEVSVLPAASHLTWQDGQVRLQTYWRIPVSGSLPLDEKEAAGRFHDLLLQAVRRRADGPVRLLLTGGIDSRLLAAAITRQGLEAESLTLGHARSFDAVTAGEVARLLGLPHRVLPIPANYVERYAHQTVRRAEGNMSVHAGWILAAEPFVGRNQPGVVMSGVGGELISGRYWLLEQQPANREDALQMFSRRKWDFNLPQKLLQPEVYQRAAGMSLQAIHRSLHAAPEAPLVSAIEEMCMQTHFRRHATARDMFPESMVADPFYDNDLVDFSLSLPMSLRLGGKLFQRTLLQHYPRLAQLPHNSRGARLTDRPIDLRRRSAERMALRALRKLTGIDLLNGQAMNINYNEWMRTASRGFARDVVSGSPFLNQFINLGAAQQMLEEHLAGRISAYRQICALITIEQFMETFLRPAYAAQPAGQERWRPAPALASD